MQVLLQWKTLAGGEGFPFFRTTFSLFYLMCAGVSHSGTDRGQDEATRDHRKLGQSQRMSFNRSHTRRGILLDLCILPVESLASKYSTFAKSPMWTPSTITEYGSVSRNSFGRFSLCRRTLLDNIVISLVVVAFQPTATTVSGLGLRLIRSILTMGPFSRGEVQSESCAPLTISEGRFRRSRRMFQPIAKVETSAE